MIAVCLFSTVVGFQPGPGVRDDPHMVGLKGQKIDWAGVDGAWYALIKNHDPDVTVNLRLTAPLPEEFPHRQLVSGVAIMSSGHSLVLEFKNPYSTDLDGCPRGNPQCLANGGIRVVVDGRTLSDFLIGSDALELADGIKLSASNLPMECWQFGGAKIWAKQYEDMMSQSRELTTDSFEGWILKSVNMAAPDWCAKFMSEQHIHEVKSSHSIFKVDTTSMTVRVNAGINHQGDGEVDWDGRVLPDLDFWQMDVGLEGLQITDTISGILGETARPMYDAKGNVVMEGLEAMRGTVEDYEVSGPLDTDFALLHSNT